MGFLRTFRGVDAHCHLHKYTQAEVGTFRGILLAAVSDDAKSSRATLDMASEYDNVVPCVGIHPWRAHEATKDDLAAVVKMMGEAKGVGEVGLDARYGRESYGKQRECFNTLLKEANDNGLPVNIHALDAWREVCDLLYAKDVEKAVFHWYNGPIELIEEMSKAGYYISVNAALKVQEKHRRVAHATPISNLLVESDGPYNYRGLQLHPELAIESMSLIAELRGMSVEAVRETLESNFRRLFSV